MTCSAVLIHYKACDGRTDYGIAVAYTCYIIGIGLLSRVKTSNATNFKKAFRHAGRLFETARLRQTKSSFEFFVDLRTGSVIIVTILQLQICW